MRKTQLNPWEKNGTETICKISEAAAWVACPAWAAWEVCPVWEAWAELAASQEWAAWAASPAWKAWAAWETQTTKKMKMMHLAGAATNKEEEGQRPTLFQRTARQSCTEDPYDRPVTGMEELPSHLVRRGFQPEGRATRGSMAYGSR